MIGMDGVFELLGLFLIIVFVLLKQKQYKDIALYMV